MSMLTPPDRITISVLIPTYRRPQNLIRCLTALGSQTRPPDQTLIVIRDSDEETRAFLADLTPPIQKIQIVTVTVPGVIAAMKAGLAETQGDIIALTDDDTAPDRDWIEHIEAHFVADANVGGVGGRDRVYFDGKLEDGAQTVVGRVQWYGRIIGNHHIGVGPARYADFLKGANCAYRSKPLKKIGFETRLRGQGAQVHWELALGLAMKQEGWKLIYDPAVAVDHHPAKRFDEDQRSNMESSVLSNAVYNETLALWTYLSRASRVSFLAWSLFVGNKIAPGLLVAAYSALRGKSQSKQRWLETVQGRWQAIHESSRGRYEQ